VTTFPQNALTLGSHLKRFPLTGTREEVGKIIMSITAKSSHLDLIKDIHFTFSDIIAKLVNLSFSEGVFPNSYKSAIVTPYKKPNLDRDDQYLILTIFLRIECLYLSRFQSLLTPLALFSLHIGHITQLKQLC